ncbi:MAG: peptidoglycan editing factor PgeF [Jiangellales bacterium]
MAVSVVFTDRVGGVSEAPFDTLNLATHVGDDPDAVAANRATVAARAGVPLDRLVVLAAVSGGPVAQVDGSSPAEVGGVEAIVATEPDLAVGVIAADCVPVLLADDTAGVIGAAHAGRRGVQARIVTDTVSAMVDLGAHRDRLVAWVGPAICGRCYEVGDDVAAQTVAVAPAARATTSWGTTALDLPAAVLAELAEAGVAHVHAEPRCTLEDPLLYSYRRDGLTGRQASVVVRHG